MRTLIENSIEIQHSSKGPVAFTVFNITSEEDRNKSKFLDISKFSGRHVTVRFKYIENNTNIKVGTADITVPENLDEQAVKAFIISEVNTKLHILM